MAAFQPADLFLLLVCTASSKYELRLTLFRITDRYVLPPFYRRGMHRQLGTLSA